MLGLSSLYPSPLLLPKMLSEYVGANRVFGALGMARQGEREWKSPDLIMVLGWSPVGVRGSELRPCLADIC